MEKFEELFILNRKYVLMVHVTWHLKMKWLYKRNCINAPDFALIVHSLSNKAGYALTNMLFTDEWMIMFEALFLYHLAQANNYILAFSFFSDHHYVQNESILTSY